MENMKTINVERTFGDKFAVVTFSGEGNRPSVEEKVINEISLTKAGNTFYSRCDGERVGIGLYGDTYAFDSKEEAEKWVAENVPEAYKYKNGDKVYIVQNGNAVELIVDCTYLYAPSVAILTPELTGDKKKTFAYSFRNSDIMNCSIDGAYITEDGRCFAFYIDDDKVEQFKVYATKQEAEEAAKE